MSTGRNKGFTLIEVVAALTILVLLAGTIFAIVSGATDAAAAIDEVQREDRRVEAFLDVFRETMSTLPADAAMELRVVEKSPLVQELVIHGAPSGFAVGPPEWNRAAPVRLGLQKAPDELAADWRRRRPVEHPDGADATMREFYFLALSRPDFYAPPPEGTMIPIRSPMRRPEGVPDARPDQTGRFWLPLVPDLAGLQFRFWHPGKKQWLDQSDPTRPPMIEILIRPRGRTTPVRAVFRPGA